MRGLLAVARREIAERRMLFVAAAIAAVAPFAVPWLHGLQGVHAADVRSGTALALSLLFLFGTMALIGGTRLPRALADRTIGFDLARPVSTGALWGGILAAALCLAIGSAFVAFLPAALVGDASAWTNLVDSAGVPLPWPLVVLAVGLLLFGFSGVFATAIRARSALLLGNVLLVPAAIAAAAYALIRLTWAGADRDATIRAVVAISLVALLGALAAGLAAVVVGRTDIRAAHRAQLVVLSATLGVGILGLYGYAWWLSSGSPSELTEISHAQAAARGPWTFVEGRARGATAGLLCDTEGGRYVRVPWGVGDPAFSEDGLVAGWIQRLGDTAKLRIVKLGENAPSPENRVSLSGEASDLTLDAKGSRAAVLERDLISVYDLTTNRLLASARINDAPRSVRLFFSGAGLLRIYAISEPEVGRVDILELDVAAHRLTRTGQITGVVGWPLLATDATGKTLACVEFEAKRLSLFDARTGRRIATLSEGERFSGGFRFLADGRLLAITRRGQDRVLDVFSSEGAILRELPFPGPPIAPGEPRYTAIGGEASPGAVIVAAGPPGGEIVYAIPLDGRGERKLGERLRPVSRYAGFFGPPNETSPPGAPASTLFQAGDGSLVRLDPATGQRTVILGKGTH